MSYINPDSIKPLFEKEIRLCNTEEDMEPVLDNHE
jgi:hypothetical protein